MTAVRQAPLKPAFHFRSPPVNERRLVTAAGPATMAL